MAFVIGLLFTFAAALALISIAESWRCHGKAALDHFALLNSLPPDERARTAISARENFARARPVISGAVISRTVRVRRRSAGAGRRAAA